MHLLINFVFFKNSQITLYLLYIFCISMCVFCMLRLFIIHRSNNVVFVFYVLIFPMYYINATF